MKEHHGEKMTKKNRFFYVVAIITVLIILVLGTGCPGNKSGYETLTVMRGIGRFSLEYPRSWKVTIVDTSENYTDVRIITPSVKVQKAQLPSSLVIIHIRKPTENITDAVSALEKSLDYWRTRDGFKLIDRSLVEIAGIQAERIRFTENEGTDFYRITEPEPRVSQELYFDYGGLVWDISISSILSHSESDKAYIEHILETFTILD